MRQKRTYFFYLSINYRGRASQNQHWNCSLHYRKKNYHSLKADVDEDIYRLERAISHIECTIGSLAEVVL